MTSIIHRDGISYQLIQVLMERRQLNQEPLPLQEAYKTLANRFNLSAEELGKANQSDGSNKCESEVRFVCTELRRNDIIKKLHAQLEITDEAYGRMQGFNNNLQQALKKMNNTDEVED